MPDTPPASDSSSSGELRAEVDTGKPKEPASGGPPVAASTPKPPGAPAPVADTEEARAVPEEADGSGRWSVRIGEVFDFGESGRFTVKGRLGRGGMGEVYRADYVTPQAPKVVQVLALKVLRPDARPRQQRSFMDEVHLLSLLRHDSIARYHTYFMDHGRQVLVMEYVEGRSLHSLIRLAWSKGRDLSESTTLELLAQVAEALDYAHAAKDEEGRPLNIVHRDISPANIMVTTAGLAKLLDFGIAKADLEDRTQTFTGGGFIQGKIPYLSPEQVQKKPLDGRSDLFSLCCVLVEMLTGDPPFGRKQELATLQSIAQVKPEDVDRATRRLSKKVRAICQKGLARDPAQRFASGYEMARAMLARHDYKGPRAIREEIASLEALPDLTPARVQKMAADFLEQVQRKRRAVGRLVGLVCAAAAAFFLWYAYRSTPPAPAAPPPMSATPERGMPNVKEETTSQAPAPALANPAPAAPNQIGGKGSRAKKALTCAAMIGATGCVHIATNARAGDCYLNERPPRELNGERIPDKFIVSLDPSNAQGRCKGPCSDVSVFCDEPCPIWEGPIVLQDISGATPFYGPPPSNTPARLFGRTSIFKATGTFDDPLVTRPVRKIVGRMTALVTAVQLYDGSKLPICGVLFGTDGEEGVPILAPEYNIKPPGAGWGDTTLHLFWPPP